MKRNTQTVMAVLQEECAEVIQAVSKINRFGMQGEWQGVTNRQSLITEIGDVLAMIDLLEKTGVVDNHKLVQCKKNKFLKLREWSNIEQ